MTAIQTPRDRPGQAVVRIARHQVTRYVAVVPIVALLYVFTSSLSGVNMYLAATVLLACIGAIALNLLMGTVGQVSLGTAAFFAVGGFGAKAFLDLGLAFPLDVVAASALAGVVGALFALPALRLRGLYLALATLAAYFVVLYAVDRYQAHSPFGSGFLIQPLFSSHGLETASKYWCGILLVIVAIEVIIAVHLSSGRSGRAWRMVRDHETAAPALGINILRVKLTSFAFTSSLMGLQGALTFHFTGSVSEDLFGFSISISYLAMIVIGGLDSVLGAIIGAAIITTLPTLVPQVVSAIAGSGAGVTQGAASAEIAYGALLILFIVIAPDGIVGRARLVGQRVTRLVVARRRPNTEAAADS